MNNKIIKIVRFKVLVAILILLASSIKVNAQPESLTYCAHPDWLPYGAIRNGEYIGMGADFLKLIENRSGISFNFVETSSWSESLELIQTNKCQVLAFADSVSIHRHNYTFSAPYFSTPHLIYGVKSRPIVNGYMGIDSQVVGVIYRSRPARHLSRYYPNVQLKFVDNASEGIKMLSRNEIDLFVTAALSATKEINRLNINDIVISGYGEPDKLFGMAFNFNDQKLIAKINAAINAITEDERNEIFVRWNVIRPQISTNYALPFLSALFSLSLVTMFIWRKRIKLSFAKQLLKKQNEIETLQSLIIEKSRTLEFVSTRDEATGLFNRTFMLHKIEDEVSRFKRFRTQASLILVDFDLVNSNQPVGDELIKLVSSCCLNCVREVDIVSRWEEKQLLILCPYTNTTTSLKIAARLTETVLGLESIPDIDLNVGIASLKEQQTFVDWFDSALNALTQAKQSNSDNIVLSR